MLLSETLPVRFRWPGGATLQSAMSLLGPKI